MKGFAAGFVTASAIAFGVWAYWLRPPPEVLEPEAPVVAAAPEPEAPAKTKKRGRRVAGAGGTTPAGGSGETWDDRGISDDLTPAALNLDVGAEGGERPISNDDVESTISKNWNRINRCILLDAADRTTPAKGTVRLGIRIRPNGSVAAVTAAAPAELQGGTVIPCLRTTVAALRFPSFEGSESVVTYPIRIE